MNPRIECVWFPGGGDQYRRLANVLRHTAARHCPGWDVSIREVPRTARQSRSGAQSDADNWWKLQHWRDAVVSAPEGQLLLLMDADTFITNSLDPLLKIPFDFAYTVRPKGARFPFNAGVVAVRANERSRELVEHWARIDSFFMTDADAHRASRLKYGGMNQASLGKLLEDPHSADIAQLPCLEWNCEDDCWTDFDPTLTRIVHVKSALRMTVFNMLFQLNCNPLARIWQTLEATALGEAAQLDTRA